MYGSTSQQTGVTMPKSTAKISINGVELTVNENGRVLRPGKQAEALAEQGLLHKEVYGEFYVTSVELSQAFGII